MTGTLGFVMAFCVDKGFDLRVVVLVDTGVKAFVVIVYARLEAAFESAAFFVAFVPGFINKVHKDFVVVFGVKL